MIRKLLQSRKDKFAKCDDYDWWVISVYHFTVILNNNTKVLILLGDGVKIFRSPDPKKINDDYYGRTNIAPFSIIIGKKASFKCVIAAWS